MFDFKMNFDSKILNVTIDPRSKTHLGEIRLKLFKDIDKILIKVQFDAKYNTNTLAKYELDGCRFADEHRKNWLLKIVVNYIADIFDMSIISCPMRFGTYVIRRKQKIPKFVFPVPKFVSIDEIAIGELLIEAVPIDLQSPMLILQAKLNFKFLYSNNNNESNVASKI